MSRGGNFVMGARMSLVGNYGTTISTAARQTRQFSNIVNQASRQTRTYADSQGRLRNELGQYSSAARQAAVSTRVYMNENGRLGASFSLVKKGILGVVAGFGLMKAKNW